MGGSLNVGVVILGVGGASLDLGTRLTGVQGMCRGQGRAEPCLGRGRPSSPSDAGPVDSPWSLWFREVRVLLDRPGTRQKDLVMRVQSQTAAPPHIKAHTYLLSWGSCWPFGALHARKSYDTL